VGKPEEKGHEQGFIGGKIILKWMLEEWVEVVWSSSTWHRIGTLRFHIILENS
jgi:hypothetical protein